jgi:hypothetical protein
MSPECEGEKRRAEEVPKEISKKVSGSQNSSSS